MVIGLFEQVKEQMQPLRIFKAASTLINFEIQKYYQNESKFNDAYSRNNLSKIKDGTHVINLDK